MVYLFYKTLRSVQIRYTTNTSKELTSNHISDYIYPIRVHIAVEFIFSGHLLQHTTSPSPLFEVKAVRKYGPNVLSFEVVTGERRWYIIGCYLAPKYSDTIERVVAALGDKLRGTALLVAGDLNTDLGDTENERSGSEIAAAMTESGVEDMTAHFLPRKRKWGRELRTWSMVREGKVVRSRTDYLLGTDKSLFRNVSVRDPRHNTDHFMVVGCLRSVPERDHARY